ncbi:HNH endonuclease [Beggiatoa leptomitoformis]|uniref:HNH endonuclease n=1 Tax=Beggiatoa leptomitoformis TaxID=288004 RepID=A0A2N9YAF7_9GAMM|nr:HNH endonuclease [Beggiatoa leptomitoformis]ALG67164.1 HNH endonuclease [Beggiatoa leptomitoformis]AUI67432.1 HNH endonuclease [Beggiatoa leptomitoformis]
MTSSTEILSQSIVVFSKNYLPISQINIKRAIALLITGKAEPLDFNQGKGIAVHSPTTVLVVPYQIRLTMLQTERAWRMPTLNRREILRRDKHTCQYCGSTKNLTIDHVIPRSKGGKHVWDNVVTACGRCNNRKGDRTPLQADMVLHTIPQAPTHPSVSFAAHFWREHQLEN